MVAPGDPVTPSSTLEGSKNVFKHMTVLSAVVGLGATSTFAKVTIERLAPENSIVVTGIDDFSRTLKAVKSTPLWALWESEEISEMLQEPLEDMHEEFDDALEELDLDEDDISWPQGPVGLAIFPGSPDDPESGPGFLAMADWGVKAMRMNRILEAMLDQARDEHDLEIPEQEVLGRTVYSINLAELAGDQLDLDAVDEFDQLGMPGMVDPAQMMDWFSVAHIVRDGRRFLACSDLNVLRDALELIDEDGQSGLTDRADFQGAMGQLGETDGYTVVLLRDLAGLMPGDPTVMMAQMFFKQIVGDIQAIGFGVRIGNDDVMVEETVTVYMPEGKSGLTTLLSHETPQGKAPPFVGPDCLTYTRFNFRFDGVMDFMRGLGAMNPMIGAQLNPMIDLYGPTIEKVCAALGPEVHSTVKITRPLTLDSLKTLYAIQSSRPGDVEAVLAEYAPGMGLEARDFLGHRIYSMDFNPMAMGMGGGMVGEGFSVGFGGGYVMIGNTSVVEDGLRASAKADMPGLDDNPGFRRAVGALSAPRSVGWGVMSIVDYLDYFKSLGAMINEQEIEQVKEWDPEYARQLEQALAAEPDMPWEDFDVAMLNRYLGPISWEIRSLDDGFMVRYMILAPDDD
jgi:hypothetical protein